MNKVISFLFICLLFLTVQLRSEELNEQKIVTLDECIRIALQNHPDIYISEESKKQAISKYKVVKGENSIVVNGEAKTIEYLKADANSSNSAFNVPGRDTNIVTAVCT